MSLQERKIMEFAAGRTSLLEITKFIFRTQTPTTWNLPRAQTKPKPKADPNDTNDNHASTNMTPNAILSKHGVTYAKNFGEYIRTDVARAKVYNTISPNLVYLYGTNPTLMSFFQSYFKLGSADCNFNPSAHHGKSKARKTANQTIPYGWQAHHLIPGEAFKLMKNNRGGTEEVFSDKQYSLLLISKYDINHGHNLIALPGGGMDFFQPVHNLILHPSNHSSYTSRVLSDMREVSTDLKEMEKKLKDDHPKVTVAILQTLIALEDTLWDLVIKLGEASVTKGVQGKKHDLKGDEVMIKNNASTTSTTYKYGALG